MVNGEKTILTNSSITAFKSCRQKVFIGVMKGRSRPWRGRRLCCWARLSTDSWRAHYRQIPYTPPTDLTSKSQAILKGVREYYPIMYLDDFDLFEPVVVEKVINGEILNPETGRPAREYAYGGKVDGLVMLKKDMEGFKVGDLLLMEHKTTSKVDDGLL